ncbi:hypothetical protein ABIB25_004265 [Nakamurella sp. UYEF19]|uniref:CG0192-related protein n=1 Tax=Nakamurella sp. UYEF19 TaxID=1756392 RepID=UPI0033912F50
MAVHVSATIVPGKLELLRAWIPDQPWAVGVDTSSLTRLGSYRFDDPAGEVGMETHLLGTADGRVLQVPLTYRGAPREAAGSTLITTMTHTVLGQRWIYDGCTDHVYATALAATILTGGREADLYWSTEDGLILQRGDTHVQGSSSPSRDLPTFDRLVVINQDTTTQMRGDTTLILYRTPNQGTESVGLTGIWPGQAVPLLLAAIG